MDCETKNNLFQWDVNVYVSVPSGIRYVDYNTDPVIRVAVYEGRARIPDELLESPGTLLMWFCVDDRTKMLHKITVNPRPVPPTHATTPAETITFATLVLRLNELMESAGEDVATLIEETKRKVNTFTSEKSHEIDTFKNEAGAKINENLQKVNTAISGAEEAKRNADQAASSANSAASSATQAKNKAEQAAQNATTAAAGATTAAGEARSAADQAELVNITSQQTSSGAVVTTTDKNGQQTSVVIKDGKPGEPGKPGEVTYIENPYDDSALRNQLSQQAENIVELESSKLTKPVSFEVGQYFRVAGIDGEGNPICEAVDLPIASLGNIGICAPRSTAYGLNITSGGLLYLAKASNNFIDLRLNQYAPIVSENLVYAVNSVLCSTNPSEALTDDQKESAMARLGLGDFEVITDFTTTEELQSYNLLQSGVNKYKSFILIVSNKDSVVGSSPYMQIGTSAKRIICTGMNNFNLFMYDDSIPVWGSLCKSSPISSSVSVAFRADLHDVGFLRSSANNAVVQYHGNISLISIGTRIILLGKKR